MTESPNRPLPVLHVSQAFSSPRGPFASDPGPCVASLMADRSPARGLRALVKSAAPRFAAQSLELVPSTRPHVHYFATASDDDHLMLSLSPRATRLLRSEHALIRSEAVLLQWLSDLIDESCPAAHGSDTEPRQTDLATAGATGAKRHVYRRTTAGLLQRFLPRLVKHGPASCVGHSEYILTRPVGGTTVAALAPPLSKTERKCLDFQVGQLLRRISSLKSPNGKFGTALAVLSPDPTASDASWKRVTATSGLNSRHDRWSDAFLAMLESSLRDAEDFKVAIRYEAVRDHVSRFRRFLDAVTSPCLVAVEAGEDTNTLICPAAGNHGHQDGYAHRNAARSSKLGDRCSAVADGAHGDNALNADGEVAAMTGPDLGPLQVTGIREWSNCVFGDPLFASVLSRNASQEVWDGFKSPLRDHDMGDAECGFHSLDDARNAEIRRLLYECHHAVTRIVREYCRRCNDSDDREMPARKRLTQALRTLDSMDDVGRKRRPHPSGEVSCAKRPKPDDEEDCACT